MGLFMVHPDLMNVSVGLLQDIGVPDSLILEQLNNLLQSESLEAKPVQLVLLERTVRKFLAVEAAEDSPRSTYPDWPSLDGVSSRIKSDWKPKHKTKESLATLFQKTALHIEKLRQQFVAEMSAVQTYSKLWDMEFVEYALSQWWYAVEQGQPQTVGRYFTEEELATNRRRIALIVQDLRRRFRPPYARRISKSWQPSLQIAKILEKRGIPRRITYENFLVASFIAQVESGMIAGDFDNQYVTYLESSLTKIANYK